jgi:hypothetical protein
MTRTSRRCAPNDKRYMGQTGPFINNRERGETGAAEPLDCSCASAAERLVALVCPTIFSDAVPPSRFAKSNTNGPYLSNGKHLSERLNPGRKWT